MKNTRHFSNSRRTMLFALAAALVSSNAYAAGPKKWSELGEYLKGKYIAVTTKEGKTVRGNFVSSGPDAIVVDDGKAVEIPRASFVSMGIQKSNLEKFGHNVNSGYTDGFHNLFSENGPWGLLEVPAVTVYTVIGAPLSLLGDLFHNRNGALEPVIISGDPK
jgi:hypothetical protein